MDKLNIIIADDHAFFRAGIRTVLQSFETINKVYEAANGQEVLHLLETQGADLIFLDLEMPDMNGLQTLQEIRKRKLPVKILVVSMSDNSQQLKQLYELKVNGYLLKNTDEKELKKAIEFIMDGSFYYTPSMGQTLYLALQTGDETVPLSVININEKERLVLQCICRQLNSEETAKVLGLSESTVKTYRSALLEKTKSKNSIGLVLFAIKNNLYKYEQLT